MGAGLGAGMGAGMGAGLAPGGLLDGVIVVEMAQVITGPMAGQVLADLGARVIKVEDPVHGDSFRRWDPSGTRSVTAPFTAFNRGKESVAIDTRTEEGRGQYRELVRLADVVVENFRPGVLDKAGIGYDDLRRVKPDLVYCDISGMGSVGPRSTMPTYDGVAQAYSGLWSQLTDLSHPKAVGPAFADQLTALYAAIAVLGALHRRSVTGEGAKVEVDMLSACLSFQTLAITSLLMDGTPTDSQTRARGSLCYGFVAQDGLAFCIHLSSQDKFWEALCRVVGDPDIAGDPRFSTKRARSAHFDELYERLAAMFSTAGRAHWLERLAADGVPSGPINTVAEAVAEPQSQALGIIGTHGPLAPVVVDGVRCGIDEPAPELGVDTDAVLGAWRSAAAAAGVEAESPVQAGVEAET